MNINPVLIASMIALGGSACATAGTTSPRAAGPAPATSAGASTAPPIAQADVEAAQRGWCDALLSIAKLSAAGGDAAGEAASVLSSAYAYDAGPVLFKPTLTFGAQTFRFDKAGALAYFVGGDPAYPDDKGFARKPWTSCTPEIRNWLTDGDIAIAMGNVHFVDSTGAKVMVDKTFGYKRNPAGVLQIVLHHSSLPYAPTAK